MSDKQIRLGWMLIPKASIMRVIRRVKKDDEQALPPFAKVYFSLANHELAEQVIKGDEAVEFWSDFLYEFGIEDDPKLLEVVL